jgi:hypothetical protein
MLTENEIKDMKFQLYERREKLSHIVKGNNTLSTNFHTVMDVVLSIYTEKIELIDLILNYENGN